MKCFSFSDLSLEKIQELCTRSAVDFSQITPIVQDIEQEICSRGDEALQEYTKKFDGVSLQNFLLSKEERDRLAEKTSKKLQKAITEAAKNIEYFHRETAPQNSQKIETTKGVTCWKNFSPINSVGLYVPGGTAPLFSTVLMLGIPAKIAKCPQVILCTPPQKDGNIASEICFAAKLLGIDRIFRLGGSQAIFAMAQGTAQIPKVDKIFGPGNAFVTAAKMQVSSQVAIDMPAGPSEVLVIADENSNTTFVASDLLSQAEHGADSQAVLLCTSAQKIEEILQEVQKQLQKLPRKEIAKKSLQNSFALLCENKKQALSFSNRYAPEHLILSFENFEEILPEIQNAGSVFCGSYSPESVGDYASGTNHTLPTSGFAKNFSGVSVESFGKWISFQEVTKEGIQTLGKIVENMAEAEGLDAHKNAISFRLQSL